MIKKISILTAAYNEEENIIKFIEEVKKSTKDYNYEIIIVDNNSNDKTLDILEKISSKDSKINYISLTKNEGYQKGILAGLKFARGEVIVTMDADLQHPPSLIKKMIKAYEDGNEIVLTKKNREKTSLLRKILNFIFYKSLSYLSDLKMEDSQSEFRLMSKKVCNLLIQLPENNKFIRGIMLWSGYKYKVLNYTPNKRYAGKSKFNFLRLIKFTIDAIISFSVKPLRLIIYSGILISFFSLCYITFFIADYFLFNRFDLPGYSSIYVGIYFFGGFQIFCLGIIAEYLGRSLELLKARPEYILKKTSFKNYKTE